MIIAKLTGILDSIHDGHLIIDVQGVGYWVQVSARTIDQLPDLGQNLSLWIEHIIRQDHQQLCGFYDPDERHCFQLLLTVQGVGAKAALSILSNLSPERLRAAISQQDRLSLTQAEGIGAKIAGRIVLELKDKIFNASGSLPMQTTSPTSSIQDALSGLLGLGYSKAEASMALTKTAQENPNNPTPETLIRLSLQKLAKSS